VDTTRTVTGTIKHLNGAPWADGAVLFRLVEAYETALSIYPLDGLAATLDSNGQFSIDLGVPDTGTAHIKAHLPDNSFFEFYLAAGPSVDLVTLEIIPGTSVAQSDLQTLLDAAGLFNTVNPTATYQMLATDGHIRADGTFIVTLIPATAALIGLGVLITNIGAGVITVASSGSDTINGAATTIIATGARYAFIIGAAGGWEI